MRPRLRAAPAGARNAFGAPSWVGRAACAGADTALFFAAEGEREDRRARREAAAVEVCAVCPVRPQCLEHALAAPERSGVWGGMGEQERARHRRAWLRRRRAA